MNVANHAFKELDDNANEGESSTRKREINNLMDRLPSRPSPFRECVLISEPSSIDTTYVE